MSLQSFNVNIGYVSSKFECGHWLCLFKVGMWTFVVSLQSWTADIGSITSMLG